MQIAMEQRRTSKSSIRIKFLNNVYEIKLINHCADSGIDGCTYIIFLPDMVVRDGWLDQTLSQLQEDQSLILGDDRVEVLDVLGVVLIVAARLEVVAEFRYVRLNQSDHLVLCSLRIVM